MTNQMPKHTKTTSTEIDELRKYRKQFEVRVASGKKLTLYVAIFGLVFIWLNTDLWPISVTLITLIGTIAVIDWFGFRKMDRQLRGIESTTEPD